MHKSLTPIALIFFLFFSFPAVYAQLITTVAGNGSHLYSGDGGPATAAGIGYPTWVSTDAAGNLYISDNHDNVIRKVSVSGTISTIAGNGTAGFSGDGGAATAAELHNPQQTLVDSAGNLYIADEDNYVVRKVDTSGNISTIAGTPMVSGYSGDGSAATDAHLYGAMGLAWDRSGDLYISDGYALVRKVNTSGIISTYAGNGTSGYSGDGAAATGAAMANPYGIAVDDSGNLFIADNSNNVVRKVNSDGTIATYVGNSAYIAGGYSGDHGPATNATLNSPYGLVTDKYGNLFISDEYNSLVRKVNLHGIITTVVGDTLLPGLGSGGYTGDGGPAIAAEISYPLGISLDTAGDLYIADASNNVIREVREGSILGSADTVCAGVTDTLYATTLSYDSDVYYQWNLNGTVLTDTTDVYVTDSLRSSDSLSFSIYNIYSGDLLYTSPLSQVVITPTVAATISVMSPQGTTECQLDTFTLVAVTTNAAGTPSYKWHINDSSFITTTDSVTYIPTVYDIASGHYIVTCILLNDNPCVMDTPVSSAPLSITVTPSVRPSITIASTASDTICQGTEVSFFVTALSSGATDSFKWYVNGINTFDGSIYEYTPANGDILYCAAADTGSCLAADSSVSNSIIMLVDSTVTPSVTITPSADTVCAGSTVLFTALSIHGGTTPLFHWFKDGTEISSGATFSYYPSSGDIVNCIVTSNAACVTSDSGISNNVMIVVDSSVIPSVSIGGSLGNTICAGAVEAFSATAVFGGASPDIRWYKDGVDVASGDTYTYTPSSGDIISCTLFSNFTCAIPDSVTSDSIVMTVNPVLTPSISITASTTTVTSVDEPVIFSATIANGGSAPEYQWLVNGTAIAGATSATFADSFSSNDSVSCMLVSDAACADTTSVVSNDINIIADLGIEQVFSLSGIRLIPNPNNGSFAITGTVANGSALTIQILNLLGQTLYTSTFDAAAGILHRSIELGADLPDGTYMVTISGAGIVKSIPFTIRK